MFLDKLCHGLVGTCCQTKTSAVWYRWHKRCYKAVYWYKSCEVCLCIL